MGAITQGNSWSDVSKCFAKSTADRSCQDAQDGYLHPKKTNPKICYKDHSWANYNFIGTGSCRSDNHLTYPNHYLKRDPTNALTRFACVKQCNSEEGCTHMEWGLNGGGDRQCVIFCPKCDPSMVPKGWAFVAGNGGTAITQGNSWSDVSKCFAKSTADRSCQDAQDGYL